MSPPYFYDYIDLTCQLDEEHIRVESAVRRIQERLNPKATQIARTLSINSALVSSNRFVLSGLVPGAIYNCSLASVRSALNFTTRSKNELAFQMTGKKIKTCIFNSIVDKRRCIYCYNFIKLYKKYN